MPPPVASFEGTDEQRRRNEEDRAALLLVQLALLRDILGNPFRRPPFEPSWRTPAVVALANGVYEDRAFDRLPVLADALEDAGCADSQLLGHCRGPGLHARGCWALDLSLGWG
jgi:hypothetical protein